MFTATSSATYSATTSATGSGSGTGNTEIEALIAANSAANNAALIAARDAISKIQNTIVSNTTLILLQKDLSPRDNNVEKTFNYYWKIYPNLFGTIQIVYTTIDKNGEPITDNVSVINRTIEYMNEYYNKGYRVFIGFNTSTTLKGVLPWFENVGTKAKGISISSSASSLDIQKPIFRVQISDNKLIESKDFTLTDASKIYYIYSEDQIASISALTYLEEKYPNKIISFSVKSDSSNLTLSNIKELYKNVDDNSVSILYTYVNTQQSDFLNVFNDIYPMPTPIYDIWCSEKPEIKKSSRNALIGKYNFLSYQSLSTSKLFRQGLDYLKNKFAVKVPNILLLSNTLATNGDIKTLSSHDSILEFNENNDIKYSTFLNSVYSINDKGEYYYKDEYYSIDDPIVGEKNFNINPLLSTF